MKQGTLFYDKESGRYDFCYDCDGETVNYGGIHCGEEDGGTGSKNKVKSRAVAGNVWSLSCSWV